jgi:hypothetical protein
MLTICKSTGNKFDYLTPPGVGGMGSVYKTDLMGHTRINKGFLPRKKPHAAYQGVIKDEKPVETCFSAWLAACSLQFSILVSW